MENSKILETFLNLLHTVTSEYNTNQDKKTETERKTQDILHMIELDELKYNEKMRLMKRLETVRRERRTYKDAMEELEPLVTFVANNKDSVHKMERLLGEIRGAEKNHMKRVYVPRTNICEGVRQQPKLSDVAESVDESVTEQFIVTMNGLQSTESDTNVSAK